MAGEYEVDIKAYRAMAGIKEALTRENAELRRENRILETENAMLISGVPTHTEAARRFAETYDGPLDDPAAVHNAALVFGIFQPEGHSILKPAPEAQLEADAIREAMQRTAWQREDYTNEGEAHARG
jgi:hypothetical protein